MRVITLAVIAMSFLFIGMGLGYSAGYEITRDDYESRLSGCDDWYAKIIRSGKDYYNEGAIYRCRKVYKLKNRD